MRTRSAHRRRPATTSRGLSGVRMLALAGLLGLTSGCGARWTDEQAAEVRAQGQQAEADATGLGAPTGEETATATDGPMQGPKEGSTQPEDASSGPAAPGSAGAGGSLPCAAPSREIGVTDDQIVLGEISSLSGPVPGLGASSAAAVRAYVASRNAAGGVCGRQLVLREADDGTDTARYRAALRDLGPKVLGISGGFAVGDIGSEELIEQLKIPIVNSPTGRTGELRWVFDINPDFPRPDMVIGKYKYLYERGARKVSMTYIAVDQSRIEANIQRNLMEAAGLQIVHVNELPLSTLSYDAPARAAANSGANYLWFIADTNGASSMARAVHKSGHKWLFKEFSYTTYGTDFIELSGAAAEGATSWLRSLPTEEASSNKAMATYVEWMERAAPGLPMDLFSIDSYVSAKAFVEAIESLPGPITREGIVQELAALTSYDADGMYAPITLGQDLSKGCFMAMIVRDGKWRRLAPANKGYLC